MKSSPEIQPLHDRVLVAAPPKPDPTKEKTVGGIIVPPSASEATKNALKETHIKVKVLAVGHQCTAVKPGQEIVVLDRQIWLINLDGKTHSWVHEKDVMAIVP